VHQALERGPHKSANEYSAFLREEFASMIQKQHWTILPAEVAELLPGIRLSPVGVVPQRDRRPRTIVDYSFYDVNADTVPLAPKEAMQFGRALHRVIRGIIRADPRFGHVYLCKVDIADGFYRVWLFLADIPRLGLAFPTSPGETPLVALPLALPMGWVNSPPYFAAATETVADLANQRLHHRTNPGPHRLEGVASTPPPPEAPDVTVRPAGDIDFTPVPSRRRAPFRSYHRRPLEYIDVYVDDFIGLAQGTPRDRKRIHRVLLQALDEVFRPLAATDSPFRQEPASVNKFLKGDGAWVTRKLVLGWLIDTVTMTIELPPHRLARLLAILDRLPVTKSRVQTKDWHKVLGELRSMAIGIPGARGLFSTLQEAFRKPLDKKRLRLNKHVHAFLADFRWLANDLARRKTRLHELQPEDSPSLLGATDAARRGMGGVLFANRGDHVIPLMWRAPFPTHIQDRLVSFSNLKGDITNSDLELAGSVAQLDILAQHVGARERTVQLLHDNTAAVYWQRKGSTTTTGPAAYLLRLQALHQRFYRYVPVHDYIPGPANGMADDCSRLWELSDSQLVSYFNATYPQPTSWRLCHLRTPFLSALTSALSSERCEPASYLAATAAHKLIGNSGPPFAFPLDSTTSFPKSTTKSLSSKSLAPDTATVVSPPARSPSDLARWRTPCAQWARRLPDWGPTNHGRITPGTPTFA
jgi:hypothetical protein